MGATVLIGYSRREMVSRLIGDDPRDSHYCVRKFFSGNDLWTLWKLKNTDSTHPSHYYIHLFKLTKVHGGWAYKAFGESDYPYTFSCPIAYLKAAEPLREEWRAGVKEYWAARKAKAKKTAKRNNEVKTIVNELLKDKHAS